MFDLSVQIWASLTEILCSSKCSWSFSNPSMVCFHTGEWIATCFFLFYFSCFLMYGRFKYDLCEVYSSIFSPASLHLSLASVCTPWWSSFYSLTPAAMQTLHFSLASRVVLSLSCLRSLSLTFFLARLVKILLKPSYKLLTISSSWSSVKLAFSARSQLHYRPLTKSSPASDKI